MKIPMTPSGIELAAVWLAAKCLKQLHHRVLAVREVARYKFDLVGVQEVRCDKGHYKSRG
jgi:hypothetical protein